MYVDIKSPQGKDLFLGMFTGKTKFPDDFSRKLTIGYNLLRMREPESVEKSCDLIIETFKQRPYQAAALELIRTASRYSQFRGKITEVLSKYFDDFVENKRQYKKQHGYHERIISAIMAGNYLASINSAKPELAKEYNAKIKEFTDEQQEIGKNSRW
jgi:hypothetical protein